MKDKKFRGTGYFRTRGTRERWWLVDPEFVFQSIGLDCVRPEVAGESTESGSSIRGSPMKMVDTEALTKRRRPEYFDFAIANLIRVFARELVG